MCDNVITLQLVHVYVVTVMRTFALVTVAEFLHLAAVVLLDVSQHAERTG